jgi:nitrogen-specific signal transduction histidine kinase/CheY-like chemotaxis protein
VRYVIGAGLDVTERRRLEQQLRQAQKMETLGTLVGGIAHDFNNQLTVILGNLELVLGGLPPEAPGRVELSDAEQAARRCADMTQRLLMFARRRVGRPQAVDVNHAVAEAVRLLQRVLPATIGVEVRCQADAWPAWADPTQLCQVLMNLAVNARDAMPEGGTLTLATANREADAAWCAGRVGARPGRYAVLSVSDTGCGMTPEVQARIFEPFFTTKEVGQGTGLGLAVVFGIVQAHGGWIDVASTPGRGSRFEVCLPAAEAAAPVAEAAPPPARGAGECVLVVDDEELVRNLARSVLERRGFRVLTAADGEEALAAYRARPTEIDAVLLDLTMPRLGGLQALRRLREINPEVRVVISSGHTMYSDAERMLAAGARAFAAKPYRAEELVRKVREALDGAESPLANPT